MDARRDNPVPQRRGSRDSRGLGRSRNSMRATCRPATRWSSSSAARPAPRPRKARDAGVSTLRRSRRSTPPARATPSSPPFSPRGCPARTYRTALERAAAAGAVASASVGGRPKRGRLRPAIRASGQNSARSALGYPCEAETGEANEHQRQAPGSGTPVSHGKQVWGHHQTVCAAIGERGLSAIDGNMRSRRRPKKIHRPHAARRGCHGLDEDRKNVAIRRGIIDQSAQCVKAPDPQPEANIGRRATKLPPGTNPTLPWRPNSRPVPIPANAVPVPGGQGAIASCDEDGNKHVRFGWSLNLDVPARILRARCLIPLEPVCVPLVKGCV